MPQSVCREDTVQPGCSLSCRAPGRHCKNHRCGLSEMGRYSTPSTHTLFTSLAAPILAVGSPPTSTKSALFPTFTTPLSFSPKARAATSVAALSASAGGIPTNATRFSSSSWKLLPNSIFHPDGSACPTFASVPTRIGTPAPRSLLAVSTAGAKVWFAPRTARIMVSVGHKYAPDLLKASTSDASSGASRVE